jgi:hypothetical protein
MSSHDSIESMVQAYAERAVETARQLDSQLDYSENSLMELETILEQLALELKHNGLQSNGLPSNDPQGGAAPSAEAVSDLAEASKVWGCYLGEVVRKRFGGDWSVETYPGKQFATLTLTVKGSKLFPSMKVHRRLTEGEADNVWTFFKMVKARLEAAPKVQ